MHSWGTRLLAAATTAALLLIATCAAASALDAFHVPSVEAQAHVCVCPSSPGLSLEQSAVIPSELRAFT